MARQEVDQCIVKGLASLGQDLTEVILYHLQTQYGITPEEVSTDPLRLGWGLHGIFGTATPIVIDLILDEAKSVKSPSEDLLHFVKGLRMYRRNHFSTSDTSRSKV
jgi:hypothetical protein